MMKEKRALPPFSSAMSALEAALTLAWLPMHVWLLPLLGAWLMEKGLLDAMWANFFCYSLGAIYILALLFRFLRRDFEPLCDAPFLVASEVLWSYGLMLLMNMALSLLFSLLMPMAENPNNQAVLELSDMGYGPVAAMSIFLAPLVEEPIFRGAVFGYARRYSRPGAFALSMLLFSLYHVWPYAAAEPANWIFLLQYLPVSYILCRCYERTNSIWGSIFLHMLINAVSLNLLSELEKML